MNIKWQVVDIDLGRSDSIERSGAAAIDVQLRLLPTISYDIHKMAKCTLFVSYLLNSNAVQTTTLVCFISEYDSGMCATPRTKASFLQRQIYRSNFFFGHTCLCVNRVKHRDAEGCI
jgi:hypothetical protein